MICLEPLLYDSTDAKDLVAACSTQCNHEVHYNCIQQTGLAQLHSIVSPDVIKLCGLDNHVPCPFCRQPGAKCLDALPRTEPRQCDMTCPHCETEVKGDLELLAHYRVCERRKIPCPHRNDDSKEHELCPYSINTLHIQESFKAHVLNQCNLLKCDFCHNFSNWNSFIGCMKTGQKAMERAQNFLALLNLFEVMQREPDELMLHFSTS